MQTDDRGCSPVSGQAASPPSQIGSQALVAKGAVSDSGVPAALARILRPEAAGRWMLPSVASMTPQYVESILRGALTGGHVHQWELFDLMLDTWPELAACVAELREAVQSRKLIVKAHAEEDEPATDTAIEKQKVASRMLRAMRPVPGGDENDLHDTIADILGGWFGGTTQLETDWHVVPDAAGNKLLGPRCTWWAHPQWFGRDAAGNFGLATRGGVVPLPPHKFIVATHKVKSGGTGGGAMLRPLAWWWCAANFASDWLLNLAQLFGLPFRWANYDPNAPQGTVDAICNMLQNMGSAGWAAFPAGTTLELKHETAGGNQSPQGDLLDRADRYARMLVLGQTLSGSSDASKGGGKAFGSVEADVKSARIDAAANWVGRVIAAQLAGPVIELNFGEGSETPCVELISEEQAGKEEADRDEVLSRMIPIPHSYLRQKYGIPEAAEGEEVTGGTTAKTATPADKTPAADNAPDPAADDEAGAEIEQQMKDLGDIEDDAVFAKALADLTKALA